MNPNQDGDDWHQSSYEKSSVMKDSIIDQNIMGFNYANAFASVSARNAGIS